MKSNYDGFRGWLNYIRDYKDNKDLLGDNLDNLKEKELQDRIDKLTTNSKEKDNLLALRNKRIDVLTVEITQERKRNDELRRNLQQYGKEIDKLRIKLQETEKARRKNAGAIGGLKAKINELKQDLEKAEHKITWLKTNQKAPSKEEIIAYETRMKEVEKRQKEK